MTSQLLGEAEHPVFVAFSSKKLELSRLTQKALKAHLIYHAFTILYRFEE